MADHPTLVFLGGPVKAGFTDGRFDDGLRTVILRLHESLERAGLRVLSAHVAEGFSVLSPQERARIARRDLGWMLDCDVYVAALPVGADHQPVPSMGTGVELGWASQLGKPIVLLVSTDARDRYSPLLLQLPDVCDCRLLDLERVLQDPSELLAIIHTLAR